MSEEEDQEVTQVVKPIFQHHRRVSTTTTTTEHHSPIPKPWIVVDLVAPQLEFFTSIFTTIFSSKADAGSLLRKLGSGLLGATYACFVLASLMVVAVVVGVGIVRSLVEEPVSVRSGLSFDYTKENPSGVAVVGGGKGRAVPAGHTFGVELRMMLPESGHNRRIGIFQVTAEVIASSGEILAKSSQPCMLRFHSLPVRLMRIFAMAVPLVIGFTEEVQTMNIGLLKYKEGGLKTEIVRVTLRPKAGTMDLPQLYEAELLMKSRLPWRKEMIYNWKWTLYVWASLYVYVVLLISLLWLFKPFALLRRPGRFVEPYVEIETDISVATRDDSEISGDFVGALRRWRARSGRKRRAVSDYEEGSASGFGGDSSDFPVPSESSECFGR